MPIAQWLGLAIPGPGGLSPKRITEDAKDASVVDTTRGKFAPTSGFTFGDACEAWMHYGETDRALRRSTATSYPERRHRPPAPTFGADTPIEQITKAGIKAYRSRLLSGPHSRRNTQKVMIQPFPSSSSRRPSRRGTSSDTLMLLSRDFAARRRPGVPYLIVTENSGLTAYRGD